MTTKQVDKLVYGVTQLGEELVAANQRVAELEAELRTAQAAYKGLLGKVQALVGPVAQIEHTAEPVAA
jgi:hypothetical protein